MSNRIKAALILCAGIFASALILGIGTAQADISNPHPTPPANSVTNVMLQQGIINPNNISVPNTFEFQNVVATTTTVTTSYSSALLTGASTTINHVNYQWPSSQGAANTIQVNDGAGNLSWQANSPTKLVSSIPAAQAITAGTPVAMSTATNNATSTNADAGSGGSGIGPVIYIAVPFTASATAGLQVTYYDIPILVISTVSNNSFGYSVVADNAGQPTGATLQSQSSSICTGLTPGVAHCTVYQTSPVTLTAGTQYWIVMHFGSGSGNTDYEKSTTGAFGNCKTSTDGASWTAIGVSCMAQIAFATPNFKGLIEASASSLNDAFLNYIGMAESSASFGANVNVDTMGASLASTTLATSTLYYLGNTAGTLSTSAGSNSLKVGVATGYNTLVLTY